MKVLKVMFWTLVYAALMYPFTVAILLFAAFKLGFIH